MADSESQQSADDETDEVTPTWHRLTAEQCAERLASDTRAGLSAESATTRQLQAGRNIIQERVRRGLARMFFAQFNDFMILVLIAAAGVSGIIGDVADTVSIVVIVALNAVIGFVQEFRAQRAIAALRKLAAVSAQVVRSGEIEKIPASELVPGDVVVLEAGNIVPADLRLIDAPHCRIDEAALTGESETCDKHTRRLETPGLPLGERLNMAFKGTVLSYGRARGLVVATGMNTELGRIAALLSDDPDARTPLQKRLARFGKRLALLILAICALVFAVGLLRGESLILMFLTAVSLAVAAIPEALPAVVTISLALGAHRMVRENALVRRLPAAETLGSVTWICADKTGTLTQNRMKVVQVYVDARSIPIAELASNGVTPGDTPSDEVASDVEPYSSLFRALALSNDAQMKTSGDVVGDPTEVALFQAAADAGYEKAELERHAPRVTEVPFDSERKRMSTVHRSDGAFVAYTKGGPETVLPLCRNMLTSRGIVPIERGALLDQTESMAAGGLRILAVAYRDWPELPDSDEPDHVESDLTLLALVGLHDPPRVEAEDAIRICKSAGIIPVMITGDHPATARAIATRLGIIDAEGRVVTGEELRQMPDSGLENQIRDIRAYARVDPVQKLRIVSALQNQGECVAMTGDGVNDAPALNRADIGIAMGKEGTDVAREAASLVLLDDNFATIVTAVRAGRRIYDNIRKFIKYTLTSNSGEILTIVLAPFLGLPIPLLPIHILWINLVTDGLPGLALASEPAEKSIMNRPPRPPRENIFSHGMWQHILSFGLLMASVSLSIQAWAIHTGSAHWQTMVFTVLTLSQMGQALAIRSERESLFKIGLLSNRPLLGAVVLTFVLQMAVIYVPWLNPIFKTAPLPAAELLVCLAAASIVFIAVEAHKWFMRRGRAETDARIHVASNE
jgi:Ca2+-transporting ATPase